MSSATKIPSSLDLRHHLSKRVRAAYASPMKEFARMLGLRPELVSLAGGMPHPSTFPLLHTTITLPSVSSFASGSVDKLLNGTAETETFHLKKTQLGTENDQGGIIDLNQVLQYGMSNGFKTFVDQLDELNGLLHGRRTSDTEVFITSGNTDGVSKAFQLFVEPEVDTVLTEEFTFITSLNAGRAHGAKYYPIKMDDEGMIPYDLELVLSTWDEETSGKKPHILYTIPCGQNPTGTVMPQHRYDEIYAICQKHDVIILEDDPYWPLQFQPYISDLIDRAQTQSTARSSMPTLPADTTLDDPVAVAKAFNDFSGVKSYLSRDVDGRVIRIDSFSKVFGPGIRLGWITCSAYFAERFMRMAEYSTQVPNNLAQGVMMEYLGPNRWGPSGFIRWMWAVRMEYQARRDHFLDCFNRYVPLSLVSTKPCGGGMMQWVEIGICQHSRYKSTSTIDATTTISNSSTILANLPAQNGPDGTNGTNGTRETTTNTVELMDELWNYLVEEYHVVLIPAKHFLVDKPGEDQSHRVNCFRTTFAGDMQGINEALQRFGKGISVGLWVKVIDFKRLTF